MISLMCGIFKKKKKKKKDRNKLICRTETDPQTLNNFWLPKRTGGMGKVELGIWDWHVHTEVNGMVG